MKKLEFNSEMFKGLAQCFDVNQVAVKILSESRGFKLDEISLMDSQYLREINLIKSGFDASIALSEKRAAGLVEDLESKLKYHEQAYGLDIFHNSETLTDKSSRDEIAARMGRHMIKCFREYINEALSKFRSEG